MGRAAVTGRRGNDLVDGVEIEIASHRRSAGAAEWPSVTVEPCCACGGRGSGRGPCVLGACVGAEMRRGDVSRLEAQLSAARATLGRSGQVGFTPIHASEAAPPCQRSRSGFASRPFAKTESWASRRQFYRRCLSN